MTLQVQPDPEPEIAEMVDVILSACPRLHPVEARNAALNVALLYQKKRSARTQEQQRMLSEQVAALTRTRQPEEDA